MTEYLIGKVVQYFEEEKIAVVTLIQCPNADDKTYPLLPTDQIKFFWKEGEEAKETEGQDATPTGEKKFSEAKIGDTITLKIETKLPEGAVMIKIVQ